MQSRVQLFCDPMDCSLPGWDLPNPGIKPKSPALAGRSFTTVPPRKPQKVINLANISWNDQSWVIEGRKCVNFFFLIAVHSWTRSGCLPKQRHFGLIFRQKGGFPMADHYVQTVSC